MIASPIWDPNDEWKPGTGYKLMIAASPKTYRWLLGKEMLSAEDSEQFKWLGEASPGEPQKATDFLALTVRALADLLVQYGGGDLNVSINRLGEKVDTGEGEADTSLECVFKAIDGKIPRDMLSQTSFHDKSNAGNSSEEAKPGYKKKAKELIGNIKAVNNVRKTHLGRYEKRHVQIPKLGDGVGKKKPILVLDLGVYFEGKEHLIPDPFLVVLKAAVSWSASRDQ